MQELEPLPGISAFHVVCDTSNTPEDGLDQSTMNVDLVINRIPMLVMKARITDTKCVIESCEWAYDW